MAVNRYSTQMPDGRLLAVDLVTEKKGETTTTRVVYSIDDKPMAKDKVEAEYNKQPEYWQRGRTFQQMIDFWQGRLSASR